jgi:heme/copper-type cytochrome/quinol oxidase subunit 2
MLSYRVKIVLLLFMGSLALNQLTFGPKLVGSQESAFASEPAHAKQEQHAEAEEQEVHHGAPLIYFVNWLLLIIAFCLVGFKIKAHFKKPAEQAEEEHGAEAHIAPGGAGIPILLIGIAVFIFFSESLSVVANYHEPVGVGLIRLLIKLITGVFLMLYGLSFMHEH